MPRSDNEGLLPQSNRSKMFWAQHQISGGSVAAALPCRLTGRVHCCANLGRD